MAAFREDINEILSDASALEEKLQVILEKVAAIRCNAVDYPEANKERMLFGAFLGVHMGIENFIHRPRDF